MRLHPVVLLGLRLRGLLRLGGSVARGGHPLSCLRHVTRRRRLRFISLRCRGLLRVLPVLCLWCSCRCLLLPLLSLRCGLIPGRALLF